MQLHEPETLEDFEDTASAVWEALPAEFREMVGNLNIQIREFADRETLDKMGIDSRYDLLGLYHGVGLPFKSVLDTPRGPDMVFLYRAPILSYARYRGIPVSEVIRHVLIHEIGHHFGFSDEDMDAIEADDTE